MLRFVLLVAAAILGLLGAARANYCSVCSDHTMCRFKAADRGSQCTNYKSAAVTRKEINLIVHRHNLLRDRVAKGLERGTGSKGAQPKASNMRKMIWSVELANIAQRWANQCNFQHDTCRNAADKSYVGQNIYWEASTGNLASTNWTKAVQDWYDEVHDREGVLNVQPFRMVSGPVVGHYTQVAWADSYKVGCGYAIYTTVRSGRTWNARIVVCNYGPGGNVMNTYMYQAGEPASKCPAGTKKDTYYTGLCART